MPAITANDGVKLAYEQSGTSGPAVVLVHGWGASRESFTLNAAALAERCVVYRYDQRFHGESEKPAWGLSVARLAADLKDFIEALQLEKPVVVGTSLGCAVIWAYVELYGEASLGKLVFVDQAPSQWRLPDWSLGSKGIYDAASLSSIQAAVRDLDAFADGNADCCLTKPPTAEVLALLKRETLKCVPDQLGKLMADHAPKDWRPLLRRITLPCLNLYGTDSGCFPPAGCEAVGTLIPNCRNVAFEGLNHWLYLEDPARFNQLVGQFALE